MNLINEARGIYLDGRHDARIAQAVWLEGAFLARRPLRTASTPITLAEQRNVQLTLHGA